MRAAESVDRSRHIIDPKRSPVVVAEIKFGKVPVKVLLANMVVSADDPALQDTEVAFDSVGMRVAAHVFVLSVVNHFMAGKCLANVQVAAVSVGHQRGPLVHVFAEQKTEGVAIHSRDVMGAGTIVTLDKGVNHRLADAAPPPAPIICETTFSWRLL